MAAAFLHRQIGFALAATVIAPPDRGLRTRGGAVLIASVTGVLYAPFEGFPANADRFAVAGMTPTSDANTTYRWLAEKRG